MKFVDTHCHIQSAGLDRGERTTRELWAKAGDIDPNDIVQRARDEGVDTMICVGCDLKDSQLAVEFARDRPDIYASVGIHPHEAAQYIDQKGMLDTFEGLVTGSKVVAVGECGLDYFYEHSPKEAQIAILKYQIELALDNDLPMIFHIREAFDDFWPIFDAYECKIRGVLHSFTDSKENLHRAVSAGLFVGVNGIVTFTKKPEQVDVYKSIPLDNLVLETDAPFLTPNPYRGTICEPRHIVTTAEFLSELRGDSMENLARITTKNAADLFNFNRQITNERSIIA